MRYLPYILLLCVIQARAQREAANWVFGGKAGLNFSCSQPQLTISPFDGLEGGASISTANGDLLFLTDGDAVWGRDFRIMPNGKNLGGNCFNYGNYSSASQSSLFVPHPGNPNLYYLFTTDCAEDEFVAGLRYSIIDKTLNNGMGDVIVKSKMLVAPTAEKIAAVFGANGKDVWVVTHGIRNNSFFAFSITAAGLNPTPITSSTGQVHPGGRGYMKFSPDGKRLAVSCFVYGLGDGIATEIFLFDVNTGKVKSDFTIPSAGSQYSVSFSPSGRFLYLSCAWTCSGVIKQYDLEAGTSGEINNSAFAVNNDPISGALQLGIDGKLYVLTNDFYYNYVGVIEFPDKLREQSMFNKTLLKLPCTMSPSWGLPNFIESYFRFPTPLPGPCAPVKTDILENVGFEAGGDCNSLLVTFHNTTTITPMDLMFPFNPFEFYWDFGDGHQTISYDFSDQQHTYASPGTYSVKLLVKYWSCNEAITVEKEITVPAISSSFTYNQNCTSPDVNFATNYSSLGDLTFEWQFGDGATSNSHQPSHTYSLPGEYDVSLKVIGSCGEATTEKRVTIHEPFQVLLGADTAICFNEMIRLATIPQQAVTYDWNNGASQPVLDVALPGTYTLRARRNGCEAQDDVEVVYKPCERCEKTQIVLGADTTICEGDEVVVGIDQDIQGLLVWNDFTSERELTISSAGDYWVSLTQGLCVTSDTITVSTRYCDECDAAITNIITRLDDDKNDELIFQAECEYLSFQMSVYNRWGKFILSTDDLTWDGSHDNKELLPGVYYYIIHYSFVGSHNRMITNSRKGWLHIVD